MRRGIWQPQRGRSQRPHHPSPLKGEKREKRALNSHPISAASPRPLPPPPPPCAPHPTPPSPRPSSHPNSSRPPPRFPPPALAVQQLPHPQLEAAEHLPHLGPPHQRPGLPHGHPPALSPLPIVPPLVHALHLHGPHRQPPPLPFTRPHIHRAQVQHQPPLHPPLLHHLPSRALLAALEALPPAFGKDPLPAGLCAYWRTPSGQGRGVGSGG